MEANAHAGPSTSSPPLHRTSSSPNPTPSSSSRLVPRPKLPSPSHSSTATSTRLPKPVTTRSFGPSSAAASSSSRRPSSFHSSHLNPAHDQPRPRLASSGSSHLPTSVSLNSLEPPPSEQGSRRASPKPTHRSSTSAPFNFLDSSPLPSPSIFASNVPSRRTSFLGSDSGQGAYDDRASLSAQVSAGGKTPYRAGFQPKGVWRARTGEFVEVRMRREEGRRGEERRLGRRLEKVSQKSGDERSRSSNSRLPSFSSQLIELHFSPVKPSAAPPPPRLAPSRRSSSAFSLDFESLRNPGDLWRGLKERSVSSSSGAGGGSAESKRGESDTRSTSRD